MGGQAGGTINTVSLSIVTLLDYFERTAFLNIGFVIITAATRKRAGGNNVQTNKQSRQNTTAKE